MGFLSRKTKSAVPVEEQRSHPIIDELQEMERAVPERVPSAAGLRRATPAAPGREAEEAAADGEAPPSADDDRNLTPSEEAEGPSAAADAVVRADADG